jgi:hypothetical protein
MKEEMCTQIAQLCMLMMARHISKQANFLWCFKFCMIDFSFENWALVPRVLVVWATRTILQAKNLVLLASLLCAYVVVARKKSCKASKPAFEFFELVSIDRDRGCLFVSSLDRGVNCFMGSYTLLYCVCMTTLLCFGRKRKREKSFCFYCNLLTCVNHCLFFNWITCVLAKSFDTLKVPRWFLEDECLCFFGCHYQKKFRNP